MGPGRRLSLLEIPAVYMASIVLRTIDRYLIWQVVVAWVAITVALFLILLSVMVGRILQEVAQGVLAADLLGTIVALKSIGALNLLAPFSLFMASMMVLGRMYRDNEIVVLWACGIGTRQMYRPFMLLALPASSLLLVLSLWTAPWAALASYEIRDEAARTPQLMLIQPGQFRQAPGSSRVLYIGDVDPEQGIALDVFMHDETDLGTEIITAQRAFQQFSPDTGERHLILEDGYRYEGKAGLGNFRILQFERSRLKVAEREEGGVRLKQDAVPTGQLLASGLPQDRAELHWRLASPISAVVLVLIAVPLARTRPREGRYGRLVLGVLFFVLYSNLLAVGYAWIEDERVPASLGLWWVHAAALGVGWLVTRSWRGLPRRRPQVVEDAA